MALKIGTRVGPYEIMAPIGAGGMGEVYRATDTKLKRDVATKVLPEDVANDRERLARFEREAHVFASLSHPHIASESDGRWRSGEAAVVSAGRIRRGGVAILATDEADGESLSTLCPHTRWSPAARTCQPGPGELPA